MTEEEYAAHKKYAGPAKQSMNRRRVGHDYSSRRMYLITMTVEGRRPLFGRLVGHDGATPETTEASVELSPLGQRVKDEWLAVTVHHPEVTAVSLQLMPDHLHGILFVERQMEGHLSDVIRGFKTSTNKAYRQIVLGRAGAGAAAPPQHSEQAEKGHADGASAVGFSAAGASAAGFSADGASAAGCAAGASAAGCAAGVPASSGSSAAVGCAAAVPQSKRDRSHESREHGLLWTPNYNDHILSNRGELDRWRQYLADNPRRLYLRRRYPELFRVSFGLRIGRFNCSAVGNRFLLAYPKITQVQCSTHFYESDVQKAVAGYMAAARGGAVLVSPSISDGEKRTMRAAFDAGLPQILITANGLGSYSKPGGAFFDACAEGRLLILSPWEHQNRKVVLTRAMCMEMNELARLIAEGCGTAAAQPTTAGGTGNGAAEPTAAGETGNSGRANGGTTNN